MTAAKHKLIRFAYYKAKYRRKDISKIFNFSKSLIDSSLKRSEDDKENQKSKLLHSKKNLKVNDEDLKKIKEYLLNNQENHITLEKIKNYTEKICPHISKISLSSVRKIVKKKLGFSFKKIGKKYCFQNSVDFFLKKKALSIFLIYLYSTEKNIIVIDETCFKSLNCKRFGWTDKNKKVNFHSENLEETFTLACAISLKCVEAAQIIKGSYNGITFLSFFVEMVDIILKKKIFDINETYFFLDNLSSHKSQKFMKFVKLYHINVIFNVAYYPEMSPIELFFNILKKKVYSKVYQNKFRLIKNI